MDRHQHYDLWNSFLKDFAEASGLVTVMWDKYKNVVVEPQATSPYSKYICNLKIWQEEGFGHKILTSLHQRCQNEGVHLVVDTFESLGVACLPIIGPKGNLEYEIFVGFTPSHFLDPVETDRLARVFNTHYNALWPQVRNQQPKDLDALYSQARFLSVASNSYFSAIHSRNTQERLTEQKQMTAEGMLRISACKTLQEMAQGFFEVASQLVSCESAAIRLLASDDALPSSWAEGTDPSVDASISSWQTLAFPIKDSVGRQLAEVYLKFAKGADENSVYDKLKILLFNLGVVLEKLSLIETLKKKESELDALNVELKRQDASKDDFIATLAHDLRAPLNSILGWSELFLELDTDELRQSALDSIQASGKKQLRLINDLLDVARMRSGTFTIEKGPNDILDIVRVVMDSYKLLAKDKGITFKLESNVSAGILEVDRARMDQAISNLVDNAFKFTPQNGNITINLQSIGSVLRLCVRDTGQGLSEEEQQQVFSKFFQTHKDGRGLGLGLTIVKRIVDAHNGQLSVHSAGLGHGCEFIITLPTSVKSKNSTTTLPQSTVIQLNQRA